MIGLYGSRRLVRIALFYATECKEEETYMMWRYRLHDHERIILRDITRSRPHVISGYTIMTA
jgi:hypothetical protein